jgi:hypothetical protein
MNTLKSVLAAAVVSGALASSAMAMPADHVTAPSVQKAAVFCGPYRCVWRPGWRYYHRPYYYRRWW